MRSRHLALLLVAGLTLSPSCAPERAPTSPPPAHSLTPAPTTPPPAADEQFVASRLEMVREQIADRGVKDTRVLEAMRRVPRHRFVPASQVDRAYADRPLPIGFGQTISQPYIVALMTELAEVDAGENVLEIGTGSGYQAAVLAELGARVSSIEIVPELAAGAEKALQQTGHAQVGLRRADGYDGWPERAPFDAILVTAAPDHIPPPLVAQLAEGGRMVIPVGPPGGYQTLHRVTKRNGRVATENVTDVAFVPLVRRR